MFGGVVACSYMWVGRFSCLSLMRVGFVRVLAAEVVVARDGWHVG